MKIQTGGVGCGVNGKVEQVIFFRKESRHLVALNDKLDTSSSSVFQVGPKPVLTIPNDLKVIGSFDLNHFSVRIMSVDYQASGPGHTAPALPGPRLSFSEDSKVILGDSADDSFAYVHHLTLYDLEARGMVRPFCMAYICSDRTKLMENFSELSECFSQASDSLKTGNRQAFSSELQRKLQELE